MSLQGARRQCRPVGSWFPARGEAARSVLGGERHRGAQWAWGPGRQSAQPWEASPTPALQPKPGPQGLGAPSSCSHTPRLSRLSVWKAPSGSTRHLSPCEPERCVRAASTWCSGLSCRLRGSLGAARCPGPGLDLLHAGPWAVGWYPSPLPVSSNS